MSEAVSTTVDVDAWVAAAADNPEEHAIRRVMRVILFAVARSSLLKGEVVIKGGVLLALGYGTDRHTKDVDFSTDRPVQEVDVEEVLAELGKALTAARKVDEAVLCRVQSHEMKPPNADASFPTLRIRVGYALEGTKQHRRMVQGRPSTNTVMIDLSFNEKTCVASAIVMDDYEISAYSLYDQIAEKYRAMIQQTANRRDRVRRQEVYDVYSVIKRGYLATKDDRETLLSVMRQKFAARDVPCERDTIDEPEIARRSRKEYARLQEEIDGELPDFDHAFGVIRDFYVSLPWNE